MNQKWFSKGSLSRSLTLLTIVASSLIYIGFAHNPCPKGAKIVGSKDGLKRWCQLIKGNKKFKHGQWTSFYGAALIEERGEFNFDLKNNHWVTWYQNGRKKSEGNYNNGKKIGNWTYWNKQGEIVKK